MSAMTLTEAMIRAAENTNPQSSRRVARAERRAELTRLQEISPPLDPERRRRITSTESILSFPLRHIVRILRHSKPAEVLLECGHEASCWGYVKRTRCMICPSSLRVSGCL